MSILRRLVATALLISVMAASGTLAVETSAKLTPGSTITIQFLDMPPTFYALDQKKDTKAQMTIFLPTNYDPGKKFALLIFFTGGNGGAGGNPSVARALCQEKDFVCASMPLFKASDPKGPGGFIMRAEDGKYMWPLFKTMLTRLDEVVPNIDPARRVLGGFSNGAHATAGLLDESGGEIARRFCAFLCVEGGGRLQHYDLLKGKPFLMVSSNAKSQPRAQQICDAAKAAGAKATLVVQDVGAHDFPVSAYPAVRQWLRGPALE